MLQLRANCERCGKELPPDTDDAMICSFECTYCAACVRDELAGECPNCGGKLVKRPAREAVLDIHRSSNERILEANGCLEFGTPEIWRGPNGSVDVEYIHSDKFVTPGETLELPQAKLKWYDLAPEDDPVPEEIHHLAIDFVRREADAGRLRELGDLGFIILHRCGREFYFLLVSSWRNANEIWESVYAKKENSETDFSKFEFKTFHRGTFCVWELAVVCSERKAWRRFVQSPRDKSAKSIYLQELYLGPA